MRLVPWRGARLDSLEETEDLGHAHIPVTLKHPQALASPHSHPGFLGPSFGVPGSIFNHFPSSKPARRHQLSRSVLNNRGYR